LARGQGRVQGVDDDPSSRALSRDEHELRYWHSEETMSKEVQIVILRLLRWILYILIYPNFRGHYENWHKDYEDVRRMANIAIDKLKMSS
jgi:hypothetical protein